MRTQVLESPDAVAREVARFIAAEARASVAAHGRFVLAVSGGHTPGQMLRALAQEDVPWKAVHVVQVDELVAPAGHPDRNLTLQRETLLKHSPLPETQIYPMPVEESDRHLRLWTLDLGLWTSRLNTFSGFHAHR